MSLYWKIFTPKLFELSENNYFPNYYHDNTKIVKMFTDSCSSYAFWSVKEITIICIYCLQIRLHEIYETPTHIYMVLELVSGGELFERSVLCEKKQKCVTK